MSCSEDRRSVRKFLDDLLDEPDHQRVRKHLENCEPCTQFIRAAGSVTSILMEMGSLSAPADLVDSALFAYEKIRREAALAPKPVMIGEPSDETEPPPAEAPAASGPPDWLKIAAVLLAVLAGVLAWKSVARSGLWPLS